MMPRQLFPALVLTLCLVTPVLAQDAPPHEGEGARPAKTAKAQQQKPQAQQKAPAAQKPQAGAKAPAAIQAAPAKTDAAGKPAGKPAGKAQRGPAVKNDGKPYLRSLDKNHDGKISREEYLAGSKKRFAKADTNHDGVVSPEEAKAAKAKMLEKEAKRDAKRKAEGKPVKPRRKSDKPPKPYLSTFDKNKDGRVSQKEYLVRREKKFSEMDLNHDGVISREEARIAKQRLLERREEKKAHAKETRLRKIEEAKQRTAGASAPGPELVAPASPPPAPAATATPAAPQAPGKSPMPPKDTPLTPITPALPAQAEPAT